MKSDGIIVVIGSVTAKQYQHQRIELIRTGLKPRIVRIDKDFWPITSTHGYESVDFKAACTTLGVPYSHLVYGLLGDMFLADYGVDASSVDVVVMEDDYISLEETELEHIFPAARIQLV